ncbi:hypothetical protein ID866_6526 [Astraeus odoratus]|nr:hypothetical protein ID866_6526 [Astraeus odoratus]
MNIPEPAKEFFSSMDSPSEILASKLVSRKEDTTPIEGGYNIVHILNLDIGKFKLFPFVLPASSPRRIMAIVDWDFGVSHVLPFADIYFELISDPEHVPEELAEEELFRWQIRIGELTGESPRDAALIGFLMSIKHPVLDEDGTAVDPPVHLLTAWPSKWEGWQSKVKISNIGPCSSRTLSQQDAAFREEIADWHMHITSEQAFELIACKKDEFHSLGELPFNAVYPFVLRHGDIHLATSLLNMVHSLFHFLIQNWRDFLVVAALPPVLWPLSIGTLAVHMSFHSLIKTSRLFAVQSTGKQKRNSFIGNISFTSSFSSFTKATA